MRGRFRGEIVTLNKYKNKFVDIIREHGLNPADFGTSNEVLSLPTLLDRFRSVPSWAGPTFPGSKSTHTEDEQRPNVFTIRFRDTGLKFVIVENPHTLHRFAASYSRYDTGFPYLHNPGWHSDNGHTIEAIYKLFHNWLSTEIRSYADEIEQPDLWQQIEQQKQLVSAGPLTDYETSPFTEAEKQQVRASIGQFRILICESFEPTQEQLEIINERLDYLSAAVDRLNRFDWKSVAINTALTAIVALTLDPHRGKQLFELFKQAFSAVLHLLQGS